MVVVAVAMAEECVILNIMVIDEVVTEQIKRDQSKAQMFDEMHLVMWNVLYT